MDILWQIVNPLFVNSVLFIAEFSRSDFLELLISLFSEGKQDMTMQRRTRLFSCLVWYDLYGQSTHIHCHFSYHKVVLLLSSVCFLILARLFCFTLTLGKNPCPPLVYKAFISSFPWSIALESLQEMNSKRFSHCMFSSFFFGCKK